MQSEKPILTWREGKVLRFITSSMRQRGFPPSIVEIGEACGLSSRGSVSYVLRQLEAKGRISRTPGQARAIVVTEAPEALTIDREQLLEAVCRLEVPHLRVPADGRIKILAESFRDALWEALEEETGRPA